MTGEPQRSVLPIPQRRRPRVTTYDAKDPDNEFDAIEPLRPPADAPNVLIVLLDDVGFGSSSAFGGPVDTSVASHWGGTRNGMIVHWSRGIRSRHGPPIGEVRPQPFSACAWPRPSCSDGAYEIPTITPSSDWSLATV